MFTLLLVPTVSYACLYLVVFYLNIAQLAYRIDDSKEKMTLIVVGAFLSVFSTVIFIIYQKRELKRFSQQ